uniref:Uncharacterized protein n=1 Tax=Arundo donax TaxID=35708 RepID=A0A0A9GGR3_ARUDO
MLPRRGRPGARTRSCLRCTSAGRSATSWRARARSAQSATRRWGNGVTASAAPVSSPCTWGPMPTSRRARCWRSSPAATGTGWRRRTGASPWGGIRGRSSPPRHGASAPCDREFWTPRCTLPSSRAQSKLDVNER